MRIAKLFTRLIATGLALVAFNSYAEPRAGVDFDYMPKAMSTEAPGKIEVLEFFWYGCPHCYHLEPMVAAWAKTLPKDVVLRREHVMWDGRSDMAGHAKVFNALKSIKQSDAVTPAVFKAIQADRIELRDEKVLFDWVAKQGVNRPQFEAAYKGFGAQAQLARATQLTRDYGIDGVPTFIINGKYKTSPSKTDGDEKRFFKIMDELIAKERGATSAPKEAAAKKEPAVKK
ncbi:thiol:disulfide interchange protein DsbA/DsbL [Chitinimonas sp. BJB300]|uniref:thiol:disulfide interchange protein DsbA/DsbL n=1 Tax=Chitinimonas sp. BJB300 TaxID=1559339 RepID=UPI000C0F4C15|nr:thiol:disulfide interchange protein DsbA/DsbL [Chitinimonas sp. BJB300]PHV12315.1 disulfide bond formation protein DsbA [Chitinimonas sp. BJB300]TSJ90937.1 thiol:disulfide interchange protein DsbA/DsbL [Chitinimonas sp. BJB300]